MDPIKQTKKWIEQFVIKYDLCPFARFPFEQAQIRYSLMDSFDLMDLAKALMNEVQILAKVPPEEVETSFLIHPNVLTDFLDYNEFLSMADELLKELKLEGIIQIASFHPQYQFADASQDEVSNYVTRSPYPMLHLLRSESVSKAIAQHPDTSQIPVDNVAKMERLGIDQLKKGLGALS